MANILQLLRNSVLTADRTSAQAALTTKLNELHDGEIVINRYGDGSKALVGIAYVSGDTRQLFTVDTEAVPSDVQDAIDALETELKELITTEETERTAADTILQSNIDAEAARAKEAEEANAADILTNKVASADKTITIVATEGVGTDIAVNIDGSTIVKSDVGVLSVASSALTQYVGTDAIAISEADTDNNKTVSLTIASTDTVLSQDENGLIANLSVVKVTDGLETNVKEQYNIVGKDSTVIGSVPVYKDSALVSAQLGHVDDTIDQTTGTITSGTGNDALTFVYTLADGTYSLVAIDVADFLRESEFKDGLQVIGGEVSVLVDTTGESFLSVSSDGVKLTGVQDAINTTVETETARATATEDTIEASVGLAADGSHVATTGNYTSTATTIAGEIAALDTQVKTNADAIDDLKAAKVSVEAATDDKYITVTANDTDTVYTVASQNIDDAISTAVSDAKAVIDAYTINNKAISSNPVIDGSDVALTGYAKGTDATAVADTDTVNAAISKLENQVDAITLSGSDSIAITDKVVSVILDSTTGDNALAITEGAGLYLSSTFDCGTY